MRIRLLFPAALSALVLLAGSGSLAAAEGWSIPSNWPLVTPFAREVTPTNAWPDYPRPQRVRGDLGRGIASWLNLNGLWAYAFEPVEFQGTGVFVETSMTSGRPPTEWEGQLLVPFAVDSALSGVGRKLLGNQRLWTSRTFTLPDAWAGQRIVLRIEASDWETGVYVNGRRVGQHRGGYDPFAFDISREIRPGENTVHLCAWDATEQHVQAIGKQSAARDLTSSGYRFQPTGGPWQTVWLEAVPKHGIEDVRITPDLASGRVTLSLKSTARAGFRWVAWALDQGRRIAQVESTLPEDGVLTVPSPKPWSPDSPFLYELLIELRDAAGIPVDRLTSYFGFRQVEVKADDKGLARLYLNGQPFFQIGPLDQGYWPDGILTPPSDAAIRHDLQFLKDIGANMVRVHVTVHPDRWYYWADRLGLLVWQDMPCLRPAGGTRTPWVPAAIRQWETELAALVRHLHNHPSVIAWVPFNEGWGQWDLAEAARVPRWLATNDPTRLVDNASGWADMNEGHIVDAHVYEPQTFTPAACAALSTRFRAPFLGECGGMEFLVPERSWRPLPGYRETHDWQRGARRPKYTSANSWLNDYARFLEALRAQQAVFGLNGFVYTQLHDGENEPNGWMLYDRGEKFPRATLRKLHEQFRQPWDLREIAAGPLELRYPARALLRPSAETAGSRPDPANERSAEPPPGDWTSPDYDDSAWQRAVLPLADAGFSPGVPSAAAEAMPGCFRCAFQLASVPPRLGIALQTYEPLEVHLNGRWLRTVGAPGSVRRFTHALPSTVIILSPEEMPHLRAGRNVLAFRVVPAKDPVPRVYFNLGLLGGNP